MPILLDRQLREQIPHDAVTFPITFFSDELASLPDWAGPLHWHPDFEIASAECGVLDYQVGQQHIRLEPGDSIFVNRNMLHGIRQLSGDEPDPMPNIVFSGTLAAPETSVIYQKYIFPVIGCGTLPFIVFRHDEPDHCEVLRLIGEIYTAFREQDVCFEMTVQRNISRIFEYICRNFEFLPGSEESRIHLTAQIRIQKMLTYICGVPRKGTARSKYGNGMRFLHRSMMNGIARKMDKDYKNNGKIKWNFTKFLIDRNGSIAARFEPINMKKLKNAIMGNAVCFAARVVFSNCASFCENAQPYPARRMANSTPSDFTFFQSISPWCTETSIPFVVITLPFFIYIT